VGRARTTHHPDRSGESGETVHTGDERTAAWKHFDETDLPRPLKRFAHGGASISISAASWLSEIIEPGGSLRVMIISSICANATSDSN
jgi:hypothetical protein